MKLEIVDCRLAHLRAVAGNLRSEEQEEISLVTGRPKRHLMIALWRRSSYSRTLLVDGEAAAVGGDSAAVLALDAEGWLFTTPLVEKIPPLAFFRLVQGQLGEMMRVRREVRSSTLADSVKCRRFYAMLGFAVSEVPVGGFRDMVLRA